MALATGLSDAVSEILPGAGTGLTAYLESDASPGVKLAALPHLLADDLCDWPRAAWLVIDDYQFLGEHPEEFVIEVVERTAVNLLVATRRSPAWASGRRFLYGELEALGHQALAMTTAEIEAVVGNQPSADIPRLVSLSSGWPAIVGLAALNAGRLPPTMPDHLYDYLAEEVMNGLTPQAQGALLDLALIGQIDPVAEEPLGGDRLASATQELARAGLLQRQGEDAWTIHPLDASVLEDEALGRFSKHS